MSTPNLYGVFSTSGENPWREILSRDRPFRRFLKASDMKYYTLNKRRFIDKSDPRYAIQYMRMKLKSRQPRRSKISVVESTQRSLYEADPQDCSWSDDERHRWSRIRYSSYWPMQSTLRLRHHANELRFPDANQPSLLQKEMLPEDWSPTDNVYRGSGWRRQNILKYGEYGLDEMGRLRANRHGNVRPDGMAGTLDWRYGDDYGTRGQPEGDSMMNNSMMNTTQDSMTMGYGHGSSMQIGGGSGANSRPQSKSPDHSKSREHSKSPDHSISPDVSKMNISREDIDHGGNRPATSHVSGGTHHGQMNRPATSHYGGRHGVQQHSSTMSTMHGQSHAHSTIDGENSMMSKAELSIMHDETLRPNSTQAAATRDHSMDSKLHSMGYSNRPMTTADCTRPNANFTKDAQQIIYLEDRYHDDFTKRPGLHKWQVQPNPRGGIAMRVNDRSRWKGSYFNNKPGPKASKFTAPGFDFSKEYARVGFPGYTGGVHRSPDGVYERRPNDENAIRNKNQSGHMYKYKRPNRFERQVDCGAEHVDGHWSQDWSPIGKIHRIQQNRAQSADIPMHKRIAKQEDLEEKKMTRLKETRFYDDFRPHQYMFRPEQLKGFTRVKEASDCQDNMYTRLVAERVRRAGKLGDLNQAAGMASGAPPLNPYNRVRTAPSPVLAGEKWWPNEVLNSKRQSFATMIPRPSPGDCIPFSLRNAVSARDA